jgi:cleavage stimulation factor subunit 3
MQNYLILLYREAVGSYAENQRITAVRKVYQRGVVNPMINIEVFWKEYCAYENVNRMRIYLNLN